MVTLLCCCLLSSAWALVSLRGPAAPPVPLLPLNVATGPGRAGCAPDSHPALQSCWAGGESTSTPAKSFPAAMEALQRDGFSISWTHPGQGSVPRRRWGSRAWITGSAGGAGGQSWAQPLRPPQTGPCPAHAPPGSHSCLTSLTSPPFIHPDAALGRSMDGSAGSPLWGQVWLCSLQAVWGKWCAGEADGAVGCTVCSGHWAVPALLSPGWAFYPGGARPGLESSAWPTGTPSTAGGG